MVWDTTWTEPTTTTRSTTSLHSYDYDDKTNPTTMMSNCVRDLYWTHIDQDQERIMLQEIWQQQQQQQEQQPVSPTRTTTTTTSRTTRPNCPTPSPPPPCLRRTSTSTSSSSSSSSSSSLSNSTNTPSSSADSWQRPSCLVFSNDPSRGGGHKEKNPAQASTRPDQTTTTTRAHKRTVHFDIHIRWIPSPSPLEQQQQVSASQDPYSPDDTNDNQDTDRRHALWYTVPELIQFRHEARVLCRQLRLQQQQQQKSTLRRKRPRDSHHTTVRPAPMMAEWPLSSRSTITTQSSNHEDLKEDRTTTTNTTTTTTRGLEQRACLERQRRRYVTLQNVVTTYRHWRRRYTNNRPPPQDNDDKDGGDWKRRIASWSTWAVRLAQLEAQRDYERAYGTKPQQQPRDKNNSNSIRTSASFASSRTNTTTKQQQQEHPIPSILWVPITDSTTMDGDVLEHGLSPHNNDTVGERNAWKDTTTDYPYVSLHEKENHDNDDEEEEEDSLDRLCRHKRPRCI